MICPGCSKEIGEDSKFCRDCGAKIETAAAGTGAAQVITGPAAKPVTPRTNKIVLFSAIAVVILVAVGIFWAVGGSNKNGDMSQSQGPAIPEPAYAAPQTQQAPESDTQTPPAVGQSGEYETSQPTETVREKKPAQKKYNALDGRWEGTWRAGFSDSGFCSVNIKGSRFTANCYDSSFSGWIRNDRFGRLHFDGGTSGWLCRLHIDAWRKHVLRCTFTARAGGASSKSGDLSLYR